MGPSFIFHLFSRVKASIIYFHYSAFCVGPCCKYCRSRASPTHNFPFISISLINYCLQLFFSLFSKQPSLIFLIFPMFLRRPNSYHLRLHLYFSLASASAFALFLICKFFLSMKMEICWDLAFVSTKIAYGVVLVLDYVHIVYLYTTLQTDIFLFCKLILLFQASYNLYNFYCRHLNFLSPILGRIFVFFSEFFVFYLFLSLFLFLSGQPSSVEESSFFLGNIFCTSFNI